MKWYFASRRRHEKEIKYLIDNLSEFGHETSFDWTSLGGLKPYEENESVCRENSYKISNAIKNSDIFVIISDKEGTDMFIELGIAVGSNIQKKLPRVYVIGEYNQRSLMHFHPSINRIKTIDDVFNIECPEILSSGKFISPKFNF